MAEKVSQEIKDLREKVYELEDEMSVSTRTNNFSADIAKSKRLLIYRYALLLQIKDLRDERRKIETRIAKIHTLKSQSARGRMLTNREMEAIENIKVDMRRREDVTEEYDNKKEIYSDKRIVYYGIDEKLIKIFFRHAEELEQFIQVNDKNVEELKKQLDESNNINESMNADEILLANADRYGDEIVDFELGIIFDIDKTRNVKKDTKPEEPIELDKEESKEISELDKLNDSLDEIEGTFEEEKEEDKKKKKYNYYNGYNLYKEDMDEIIFDSIDQEVEEDIAKEAKNNLDDSENISTKKFEVSKEDMFKKSDFLNEENENVKNNSEAKKINVTDDDIFKKSRANKTVRSVKEKIALKEKLENYINQFGNDMTREYYNNEIRNTTLDTDETIDKIDTALLYDIYELGILYSIDQLIKKKKATDDGDEVKILINKLYQIKMQYKLFPGFCYNDVKEFDPEEIVAKIREFDNNETNIDIVDMHRAINNFTISCDSLKQRYREFYNITKENTEVFSEEINTDEEVEITNE